MSAIASWRDRVSRHHEQTERVRGAGWGSDDIWQPLAGRFVASREAGEDPQIARITREVRPDSSVLDVGGGAGRIALPLAQFARQITVVEPSASMTALLRRDSAALTNLTIVEATWEDAAVEPADVVICSHVVYGVSAIDPFITKLLDHARERLILVAHTESPMALVSRFWEPVHGEPRVDLPALPELVPIFWELGRYPDIEMFPPRPPQSMPTREAALDFLRHFLFIQPDTPEDARLQAAMTDLLVETPAGLTLADAHPRQQGIIVIPRRR